MRRQVSYYSSSKERLQLSEVRRTKTSDRIPAGGGGEAVRVAAGVVAGRDVVECRRVGIQPRVEEAEHRLARVQQLVVEERDDGREDRGRA